VYATGSQAGQLQWRFYIGGGLTSTGVLSPAGDVLYGGIEVTPQGSGVYALQLPGNPAPSPPAAAPPSDDAAAALRGLQIAFALLFLFTWLANLGGVCYYCRSKQITVWPQPLLSAFFLYVRRCAACI
jgi:hypothetical protein